LSKTPQKNPNHYLKYSGMVFQLFALLIILAYLGKYLDEKLAFEKSYMTALLLLTGTVAYMYKIVKELS